MKTEHGHRDTGELSYNTTKLTLSIKRLWMTKISTLSNSLGINLSYRYYLRLELLTEDVIRTFKANTIKLTVWMGKISP